MEKADFSEHEFSASKPGDFAAGNERNLSPKLSLDMLLSSLPGMVYRCRNDSDWSMEFVSARAEDLTGYPAHRLMGEQRAKYAQLIHRDDRDRIWRGLVSPSEFIPLAKETGMILPIGHWVLETACAQLVTWQASPETAALSVAVNVGPRQFRHPDFVEQVLAVLRKTCADPRKLRLELTESPMYSCGEEPAARARLLRLSGIRAENQSRKSSKSCMMGCCRWIRTTRCKTCRSA